MMDYLPKLGEIMSARWHARRAANPALTPNDAPSFIGLPSVSIDAVLDRADTA
jgi:hypothetical protein